jgi:hypothetical protein
LALKRAQAHDRGNLIFSRQGKVQNSPHRLQPIRPVKPQRGLATKQTAVGLASEFSFLARYLGDTRFCAAVQDFSLEAASSKTKRSAKSFPDFMAVRFKAWSEIGELARLEQSFLNAERIEDGKVTPLARPPPKDHRRGKLRSHPSAQLLVFTQNTTSIWSCLVCEEVPPRPYKLDQPQHVLVWQQHHMPRFRILGDDEAGELAAFRKHPSQKSAYFRGWLEAGLVTELAK